MSGSLEVKDLILPSLPNRFLAIVPATQGADLAKQAAAKVRSQWQEISQAVRLDLENVLGQSPVWSATWERQTNNLFEAYWQVYPWLPEGHAIQDNSYQFLNPHKPYLGEERTKKIEDLLKIYAKSDRQGGGAYPPNIGTIYSNLYFITDKALNSRKGLRNFPQIDETGDKSTLGGERAALYDGIDCKPNETIDFDRVGRSKIREFWQQLSKRLCDKQRYEIQDNGQERLDAVELTKRCVWQSYFRKQPGFESSEQDTKLRFPSTNNVASASFKDAIITRLKEANTESLQEALLVWLNTVYPISQDNQVNRDVIPYLAAKVSKSEPLLNQFIRLDGRLLFEETYQHPDEFTDVDQTQIEAALRGLKDFLRVANEDYKIAKPRKYFAVLMMDGDEMGKWIAGDKMPNYEQALHPDTRKALKQRGDWQQILENPCLMSPAIHGFISKALGDFSLKLVRHIVETRHPGKLVYAGGDDVLALLPLDSALKVARELRAAFSAEIYTGEVGTDEECTKFEVKFGTQKTGYVWLELIKGDKNSRRLLATMGHQATASTGIVIAHRTQPLDLTLQEVRKAEKAAKNQEGRNAFSLTFLKRSGEIMSAGAKWTYAKKSIDTLSILLEFQCRFADNSISSKFPYILREQAESISSLEIPELYTAEIKRLILRQQGGKKISREEQKQLADDLAKKLATLVTQANNEKRLHAKNEDKDKPQGKLKTFADLLVFTRFLVTGEGEE